MTKRSGLPVDKPDPGTVITGKSKPRNTVSSSRYGLVAQAANQPSLVGVAVVFKPLCAFAFPEVSRTIIVTVHFLIWKVKRIRPTPFPP